MCYIWNYYIVNKVSTSCKQCFFWMFWMSNGLHWTRSEGIAYRSMFRHLWWMLFNRGEEKKEQRWSMKRRMNRGLDQRRRHCVFYSYRPLAPSVGSKPEQPELQSSPNSPVTKREDAERGREVKHRWTKRVKIWGHTFCMYMLQWSHKGVPPPSASLSSFNLSIAWALSVIYEKFDLTKKKNAVCVGTGRMLSSWRGSRLCSSDLERQLEMNCNTTTKQCSCVP